MPIIALSKHTCIVIALIIGSRVQYGQKLLILYVRIVALFYADISKFEGRTFLISLWPFYGSLNLQNACHITNQTRPQCQQQPNGLSREFIDHYLFDTCNNAHNNEILHPFITDTMLKPIADANEQMVPFMRMISSRLYTIHGCQRIWQFVFKQAKTWPDFWYRNR